MNGRSYSLLATRGNYEKKFGPFIRHLSGRKTEKIASFNRARQGNFFQDAPQHQNPFTGDPFLQRCLKRYLSTDGKLTLFVARGDIFKSGNAQNHPLMTSKILRLLLLLAPNYGLYLLTYMGVFGFGLEATYRPIRQLIFDKWHLGR